MPARDGELVALLKKVGSVVLDGSGNGTLYFDPDNANQRWEITGTVISTNQGLTTPYPLATGYIGPETSPGNAVWASASGNQDVISGCADVGNADSYAVVWTGGVPGSTAFAQVSGTKYTRRT
jgi:hypothetical protein